jgi:hypothetical protein
MISFIRLLSAAPPLAAHKKDRQKPQLTCTAPAATQWVRSIKMRVEGWPAQTGSGGLVLTLRAVNST